MFVILYQICQEIELAVHVQHILPGQPKHLGFYL